MKKFKSIVILSLGLISGSALADGHKNSALLLIETMNLDSLMSESVDQLLAMQLQTQPQLQPFEHTIREFFNTYMSGESLRDDFVQLYMDAYTQDELEEMIAFLQTPTGQKSLKLSPLLMRKGVEIGQKRMMESAYMLDIMIEEEAKNIRALQEQQGK
ncbi:DUF2059 domain-containing protein [Photobacterium satsumensis]|uniref:DUF2059 domain-containing protein n=1 Tax=Photobacterium satsumensis TaxID=2910239 RepID=UPI003D0C67D5